MAVYLRVFIQKGFPRHHKNSYRTMGILVTDITEGVPYHRIAHLRKEGVREQTGPAIIRN